MNASSTTEQRLFGLFELDHAGTVLYWRIEPEGKPCEASRDISGLNFYEEVAPFENIEEFRRRVARFTDGASLADKFSFNCRYEDYAQPVRVLLARVRERTGHDRTKSVLVHIRKGA